MTFTDDTKAEILATLTENRKKFLSSTLELVDDVSNQHYRIGSENIQFGDIHSLRNIIESTILDNANPAFTKNGIIYKVKGLKLVEYKDFNTYFQKQYSEIEESIKKEFWLIPTNQERFNRIANFKAYSDITVEKANVTKLSKYGVIYEADNWQKFHQSLINIFLPDFKFDIKRSSRTHRYVKPISDKLFLCIEYDYKQELQAIVRGTVDLGKYRLVLLNSDFNRKTKSEEYYYNTNHTILDLGNAVHPIFINPCTEVFRFNARENLVEVSPNKFSFKYWTKFEYLPDDKIRLYNSEEFGDTLKRHAFFYMDIYSYYFRQYLRFLETCLVKDLVYG